MSWTYDDSPATSPRDEVRLLVGDTNRDDPQLSDGEIAYFLGRASNVAELAALLAMETLYLKYARLCDESVGPVSVSWSQRMANMAKAMDVLRTRLANILAIPWAGGIYRADVIQNSQNSALVQPRFRRDVLGTPGVVDGDYSAFLPGDGGIIEPTGNF